jgi:lysyl endopeptidase
MVFNKILLFCRTNFPYKIIKNLRNKFNQLKKPFMKNYSIKLFGTLSLFFLLPLCSFSQISIGGSPFSDFLPLNEQIQTVTLPAFDYQSMIEEDRLSAMMHDVPLRYGRVFEVNYNLQNSGTWTELSDGSRIWRLKIKSDNAYSINLIFGKYLLPEGATLYIYDPAKNTMIGGFTKLNNNGLDKIFATAPVKGEETIIEYYEPYNEKGNGILELYQATHAYRDLFGFDNLLEVPCNININCPVGAPWVNEKRAATRITFNQGAGSYLCSGALINNTQNDRTPYYLTAEHCAPDNHNSMVFYFNYESEYCIGTTGSLGQTISGASFRSANFMTDFRLVMLNNTPPSSYNAFFLGWDRTGNLPQNATSIHHPGGAVKKISKDTTTVATSNGFGGRLPNGFWRVIWDVGMTEGGSSGSPLLDQNNRVVGQNLGGNPANCDAPWSVQKYFGKFSESWSYGGSSTNQLKDWLDQTNTGQTTVDGINNVVGLAPIANFTVEDRILPLGGGSVNFFDLSVYDPTTWQWSFPGANPTSSTVKNPTNIVYTNTGLYPVSLTVTNAHGNHTTTLNGYIRVEGVPMNTFSLISPVNNTTIITERFDTTKSHFDWESTGMHPSLTYKFTINRIGSSTIFYFSSNNNGNDTFLSLRSSQLDSLAVDLGTVGDSVRCLWRVYAYNGLDSLVSDGSARLLTLKRNTVSINPISNVVPVEFKLHNNYPNPFNPETKIRFDIPNSQRVSLKIYNMLGKEIAILVNEVLSTGVYEVNWNAINFSSGTYFYRLETDNFVDTKRMVLLK